MQRIIGIVALLFVLSTSGIFGQAGAIDKYFSKYVDDERFTVVYISPRLISMFSQMTIDNLDSEQNRELKDAIKELRSLKILSTEETPKQFFTEFKNKISTSDYEVLMLVRDTDGSRVEFFLKEHGNDLRELLLFSIDDDEFTLLSFIGRLDIEKLSKLLNDDDEKKEVKKNEDEEKETPKP